MFKFSPANFCPTKLYHILFCFNPFYSQINVNVIQLLSAKDMAQRTVIGKERIVYSTEKDFDEQGYEAREWEKKFEEL